MTSTSRSVAALTWKASSSLHFTRVRAVLQNSSPSAQNTAQQQQRRNFIRVTDLNMSLNSLAPSPQCLLQQLDRGSYDWVHRLQQRLGQRHAGRSIRSNSCVLMASRRGHSSTKVTDHTTHPGNAAISNHTTEKSPWSRDDIQKMKVAGLRMQLKERCLKSTGLKADLVERLFDALSRNHDDNASPQLNDSDELKSQLLLKDKSQIKKEARKRSKASLAIGPISHDDGNDTYILLYYGYSHYEKGQASTGMAIYHSQTERLLWSGRQFLNKRETQLEAEYIALLTGLKCAHDQLKIRRLQVQGNSETLLKQLNGENRVNNSNAKKLYQQVVEWKEMFDSFDMRLVDVDLNDKAKKLARTSFRKKDSDGVSWLSNSNCTDVNMSLSQTLSDSSDSHSKSKSVSVQFHDLTTVATASPSSQQAPIPDLLKDRDSKSIITQSSQRLPTAAPSTPQQTPKALDPNKPYVLRFDGGCRSMSDKAGAGMVLYEAETGHQKWYGRAYLDTVNTNNKAEYTALLLGLQHAKSLGVTQLMIQGDSLLVIRQLQKFYKVRSDNIRALHNEIVNMLKKKEDGGWLEWYDIGHIPRGENGRADELATEAMNTGSSFDEMTGFNVDVSAAEKLEDKSPRQTAQDSHY